MSGYISSFGNRLYVASESRYGVPGVTSAANRIPAVQFVAHQKPIPVRRRDKTGSRTFIGLPSGLRTETFFQLRTYMTSWVGTGQPGYGPLFQCALGAVPQITAGLTVAGASGPDIQTVLPHGLTVGSGISFDGEIRFVTNVTNAAAVQINAPFAAGPPIGSSLAPCITYKLATSLPSVTIYDYWSPSDAVSRAVAGAAVNEFEIKVNGDFHEFLFSGPASDLLDSMTYTSGSAGSTAFPVVPNVTTFDYSIVPGHLGQVWPGNNPTEFLSLTSAGVSISNHIQTRATEYGASKPLSVVPGPRQVEAAFSLLALDDDATASLYAAAKLRIPIPATLQLGQQQGRLMGIYLPAVTPELPVFDDIDTRLQWTFRNCLASGVADDEIYLAFA